MRIAGGEFCGRTLLVPKSDAVRPTQDRVRESLFGILAPELPGAEFLDLFAGSGSVGLEALSRGAASATFVESNRRHLETLSRNVGAILGASASARLPHTIIAADAYRWLERYVGPGFTIGFADPPYALGEERGYAAVLGTMAGRGVIRPGGLFVAEMTAVQKAEETPGWELLRDRKYGKTRVCIWRRALKGMQQAALSLAMAVCATCAAAAEPSGAEIAAGRTTVQLDDGWRFRWGRAEGDVRSAAFDDSGWQTVDLPHDAQFEQPWTQKGTNGARGFKPMGEMWYRKRFRVADLGADIAGKRVYLELGGILCVGDVYLNGKMVASTDYGYLPVWADLTDALDAEGENVIAVWCSTGRQQGSRWYTGAGLYRDAKLVVKPEVSVLRNGIFVKTRADARDARVDVSVQLEGFRGKGRAMKLVVAAEIKDAEGNVVASASAIAPWSKLERQEVALPEMRVADARLWDIDSPNLYTAEVSLVLDGREIDRDAVRFGVRTIEMDGAFGLKLNGRKVFVKSISGHHDLGLVGAAAYPRAIRRQFETMKGFGYNAIRCSHNPYSEEFYDLADEMGILVLDELIDKWSDKSYWFGRRPFTAIWPELVMEWVKRDRNHPSVFAWSFGNELQMREDLCGYAGLDDWGVTMYRVMKVFLERWDATRPTTVCMYPDRAGALGRKDRGYNDDPKPPELSCVTDFASFNYVWPDYENYRKHVPGMNVFQSEATVREGAAPYFGMDYDTMIGCSYWGAIEYWGESNGWPKKGWNYAFFSHTLEPFPVAYLIKSAMCPETPVVAIAVPTGKGESEIWNDVKVGAFSEAAAWEGAPGETKDVKVYTNCREVELILNGRTLGVKPNDGATPQTRNIVGFEVPFEPGTLEARGRGDKTGGAVATVTTAGEAVQLHCEVEADDYVADGKDLIYVRCRAVDKRGNQVRGYTGKVAFESEGAARFLGCDNGDHYTDELFTSEVAAKEAKGGFILGVFRTGRAGGEAKIRIKPDGLPEVIKTAIVKPLQSRCRSAQSRQGRD